MTVTTYPSPRDRCTFLQFLTHMRLKAEMVDTPRVRPLAISMFLTGSSMGVIAPVMPLLIQVSVCKIYSKIFKSLTLAKSCKCSDLLRVIEVYILPPVLHGVLQLYHYAILQRGSTLSHHHPTTPPSHHSTTLPSLYLSICIRILASVRASLVWSWRPLAVRSSSPISPLLTMWRSMAESPSSPIPSDYSQ